MAHALVLTASSVGRSSQPTIDGVLLLVDGDSVVTIDAWPQPARWVPGLVRLYRGDQEVLSRAPGDELRWMVLGDDRFGTYRAVAMDAEHAVASPYLVVRPAPPVTIVLPDGVNAERITAGSGSVVPTAGFGSVAPTAGSTVAPAAGSTVAPAAGSTVPAESASAPPAQLTAPPTRPPFADVPAPLPTAPPSALAVEPPADAPPAVAPPRQSAATPTATPPDLPESVRRTQPGSGPRPIGAVGAPAPPDLPMDPSPTGTAPRASASTTPSAPSTIRLPAHARPEDMQALVELPEGEYDGRFAAWVGVLFAVLSVTVLGLVASRLIGDPAWFTAASATSDAADAAALTGTPALARTGTVAERIGLATSTLLLAVGLVLLLAGAALGALEVRARQRRNGVSPLVTRLPGPAVRSLPAILERASQIKATIAILVAAALTLFLGYVGQLYWAAQF